MRESTKTQALSAKYMLMYQRALLDDVMTSQHALRAYMLTCQCTLHACVPYVNALFVLTSSNANEPWMLLS